MRYVVARLNTKNLIVNKFDSILNLIIRIQIIKKYLRKYFHQISNKNRHIKLLRLYRIYLSRFLIQISFVIRLRKHLIKHKNIRFSLFFDRGQKRKLREFLNFDYSQIHLFRCDELLSINSMLSISMYVEVVFIQS